MGINVMSGLGFADRSVHQSELDVVADRPLRDVRQLAQLVSGKGLGVHVQRGVLNYCNSFKCRNQLSQ